jgi:hypothetical protein
MTALIHGYRDVSIEAIMADPKRGYVSMSTYTNDLNSLKSFVTNRSRFLTNHAELKPLPPIITEVILPDSSPAATSLGTVSARIQAAETNGIDSVWLYYRTLSYGRFTSVGMVDDGTGGYETAGDGVFTGQVQRYQAGTKVRFYIEARAASAPKAAAFSPARAEEETYSYRVALSSATNTPVIINELMADNARTYADPQGQFDDWIELHNITDAPVSLTGRYLTDEPTNPRKWQFPTGTTIPADGYLVVWADENGSDSPGLHVSFKLSKTGEEVFLIDTDENHNLILDHVSFGDQQTDLSYGRPAADPDTWSILRPSPGTVNP